MKDSKGIFIKKLLSVFFIATLLFGCTSQVSLKQEEPKIEPIELSLFETPLYLAEDFPLYVFESEEELTAIKKLEPFDATKYRSNYQEFDPLIPFEYEIYGLVDNEFQLHSNSERAEINFYFPSNEGTYLIILTLLEHQNHQGVYEVKDDSYITLASIFTIGEDEYKESVKLDIFNSNHYTEDKIVLLEDKNQFPMEVSELDTFFNKNVVITKEPNSKIFFKDFDYYSYDYKDDTKYEMLSFRNGNEIHYNNEIYYVEEVFENELSKILTTPPTHFLEVVGDKEIKQVEVYYDPNGGYVGKEPIRKVDITSEQENALKEALLTVNLYDTQSLYIGIGWQYEYFLAVTTENNVYYLYNSSDPLYIEDEKNDKGYRLNACFTIHDLLENIHFNFDK